MTTQTEAFKRYLDDCDKHAIVPDIAGAFHFAWQEALAQPEQPKVRTGDCLLTGFCASEGHKIQKAEPEQEPVAWMGAHDPTDLYHRKPPQADVVPLYTTPPQRTWVGLTDEEFTRIQQETPYTQFMTVSEYALQCQIKHEAMLKDKNT